MNTSIDSATLREELRPRDYKPVRVLVEDAGVDVSDWAIDRNDQPIDNPNQNVYKSFKWSFGGQGQPIVLCIWHAEIDWGQSPPVRESNQNRLQEELNALC